MEQIDMFRENTKGLTELDHAVLGTGVEWRVLSNGSTTANKGQIREILQVEDFTLEITKNL